MIENNWFKNLVDIDYVNFFGDLFFYKDKLGSFNFFWVVFGWVIIDKYLFIKFLCFGFVLYIFCMLYWNMGYKKRKVFGVIYILFVSFFVYILFVKIRLIEKDVIMFGFRGG